ncbi:hypothetical protein Sgly_1287 [Syntrophobotulus glycolicus DSM 8271]|uniref:ABC-2 type transporter n=1 Tax=Syntrophobotulus glycolicus (strain DSM 8271 / FlGlyR) TaxID=645991 RepID=F0SV97_SYNGF|nr:hypothetical protein [Syntrophobotulus glycolicus]ADY55597.1 hypothetical protein Sgly_1287 [Syntrophobotulus glycolicus DSM 8271]
MNKKLRLELQAALKDRPAIQISEEHLVQTMREARIAYQNRRNRERIRHPAFLLRQVRFVGAPVWLLQGFMLLCAFWLFGLSDIGAVSNFAPRHLPVLLGCFAVFIAMTSIPFIGRSARYRMLETEMAARISIPKLLLARIFIIGIGNVPLLTVSFLLANTKAELGTGSIALYLLLPYLIACCGCLFIQAYAHSGQQGFICTAFCFSLTALLFVLYKTAPVVYEQASVGVWGALCALCVVLLIIGIYRLLDKAASLDLSPNGI